MYKFSFNVNKSDFLAAYYRIPLIEIHLKEVIVTIMPLHIHAF